MSDRPRKNIDPSILSTMSEVDSLKIAMRELNWGLKQSDKELKFKDEHIKKLEDRIKQLTNPSDGRCMEIGALRERDKLLKSLLKEYKKMIKEIISKKIGLDTVNGKKVYIVSLRDVIEAHNKLVSKLEMK